MTFPYLQITDSAPKLIVINETKNLEFIPPALGPIVLKQEYNLLLVTDQGFAGPDVSVQKYIAGEDISARALIYISGDGKAYKASSVSLYLRDTPVTNFGFAVSNVSMGGQVNFKNSGTFDYPGLNVGNTYFMGLNGLITNIVPTTGNLLQVGTVEFAGMLSISFGLLITLREP